MCLFVEVLARPETQRCAAAAAAVGEQRQKKAEKMMDDGEGAGGHGYS